MRVFFCHLHLTLNLVSVNKLCSKSLMVEVADPAEINRGSDPTFFGEKKLSPDPTFLGKKLDPYRC